MIATFRTTLVLCLLAPLLSGCIVFEIRDQLRASNEHLTRIDQQLGSMQQSLAEVHDRVGESNQSLKSINESMEPIRVSLRRIDDELAGFRQTIEKVDKFVPGKISPDTAPPVKQAPTTQTTPQNPTPPKTK